MSEDSDFSNGWDNINEEDWDETIETIISYDNFYDLTITKVN